MRSCTRCGWGRLGSSQGGVAVGQLLRCKALHQGVAFAQAGSLQCLGIGLHQLLAGGNVGLPIIQAHGVQHALQRLGKSGMVILLQPLAGAQLVLVTHIDIVQRLPMVLPHFLGCGDLPAPQKVGRFKHLQRATVALCLLCLNPLRVQVTRLHLLVDSHSGAIGFDLRLVTQVLHIQGGVTPGELAHRQRNAAQVLKRVITGEHAVGVGSARQQCRIYLRQIAGVGLLAGNAIHGCARRTARSALPVHKPMPHAGHVELGQLCVGPALVRFDPGVAGQRAFTQTRAISPLLIGKNPCGRPSLRLRRTGTRF